MGPLTPGSACQKNSCMHPGPPSSKKSFHIGSLCQGSGVQGQRSRRAPGRKAEAEESIPRGGPDVVLDSAVTGGEGQGPLNPSPEVCVAQALQGCPMPAYSARCRRPYRGGKKTNNLMIWLSCVWKLKIRTGTERVDGVALGWTRL